MIIAFSILHRGKLLDQTCRLCLYLFSSIIPWTNNNKFYSALSSIKAVTKLSMLCHRKIYCQLKLLVLMEHFCLWLKIQKDRTQF